MITVTCYSLTDEVLLLGLCSIKDEGHKYADHYQQFYIQLEGRQFFGHLQVEMHCVGRGV